MNDIVVRGEDGSTWRYHALHGPQYSASETGWVLVLENASEPLDPQALSAPEVLGDLRALEVTNPPPDAVVQFFTERMIETLDRRVEGLVTTTTAPEADRARLAELREELIGLAADSTATESVVSEPGTDHD